MENSATKALSFPNWAKLRRDKENYPTWRKHIFDVLQAIGCDQAIRSDFARLTYESDDSSSSDDDSDGIDLSRLDLRREKYPPQSLPSASPTPSQEQLQEQRIKQLYDSLQLTAKKAKKEKTRKQKELDEKIVSSSAIEYYPDELKSKQLAKNQEDEKQKAVAAAEACSQV